MAVTETQIKQWKETHGRIVMITVSQLTTKKDKKGNFIYNHFDGYFRRPEIKDLSLCETTDNMVDKMVLMYNACMLEVPEEVKEDEELKYGMMLKLSNIFKVTLAEVKEL